jgi:hypothetical protein
MHTASTPPQPSSPLVAAAVPAPVSHDISGGLALLGAHTPLILAAGARDRTEQSGLNAAFSPRWLHAAQQHQVGSGNTERVSINACNSRGGELHAESQPLPVVVLPGVVDACAGWSVLAFAHTGRLMLYQPAVLLATAAAAATTPGFTGECGLRAHTECHTTSSQQRRGSSGCVRCWQARSCLRVARAADTLLLPPLQELCT